MNHTEHDAVTNDRLDRLWNNWSIADTDAAERGYDNDALNAKADTAWLVYKNLRDYVTRREAQLAAIAAETKRREDSRRAMQASDPWETDEADVWDTGDSFSAYSGDVEAYRGLHW